MVNPRLAGAYTKALVEVLSTLTELTPSSTRYFQPNKQVFVKTDQLQTMSAV